MLLMSSFVFAASPSNVAIKLSLINQNPDPVSPGEYVTIKVQVENYGQEVANDFKLTLVEGYPFSLDPGKSSVKELGTIGVLRTNEDGTVVDYELRVASDAVEGNNKLTLNYEFEGSKQQSINIDVEVKTQDTGLSIESVSSDALEQGKKGYVEVIVSNPSDSVLRDVTVQLDLATDDLPIAPVESSTTKTVKTLKAGAESTFRFALMPYPDASAQVYRVPVEITYYNSFNELVTKIETIGLIIGTQPDITIYTESEGFFAEAKKGTVMVDVVNKGLIDLKFLEVVLEDTEDYEVVSSKQVYIGSVDSDDFESAEFTILRKNDKNPFDIKFSVDYKDANNVDYMQDLNLPVKLYPADGNGNFPTTLVVILLVVAGYFIYKRMKRSKKK